MIVEGCGGKMPCESCAVQFSVFKRKRVCSECERYYCSGCLRRGGGAMCAPCRVLSTRPLYRNTIAHLKVRDLQCFLQRQNVSTRGCVEKEELINLCVIHVNGASYRRRGARSSGAFSSLKGLTNNINDFINNAFDLRASPTPAPPPPAAANTRNCFNSTHAHRTPAPPGNSGPAPPPRPNSERFTTTPGGEAPIEVPVPAPAPARAASAESARVESADCFEIEDLDDSTWELVARPADPLPNDSDVLLSTTDGTALRGVTSEGERTDERAGERMREWLGERVGEWTGERVGEWTGERVGEWTGERVGEWTGERVGEWTGERVGEWTGERGSEPAAAEARHSAGSRHSGSDFERVSEPEGEPRPRPTIPRDYLTPGLSGRQRSPGMARARAASELELRGAGAGPGPGDTGSLKDELPDRGGTSNTASPCRVELSSMRSPEQLEALSVKQLKELLARNRVEYRGCLERADLLDRARLLWRDHNMYRDELENLPIEESCKICMAAPLECVLLECGHIAACTACSKQLAECPICRQYVVRAVRCFRS